MLIRALFPKHKDVLIINDVPVKGEILPRTREDTYGDKFSAISNLGMLTAFRKGTLDIYSNTSITGLPIITQKDIFTTYLDYSYYGEETVEKNFDFCKEFKKRKELEVIENEVYFKDSEGNLFYKLEHQKDVYISHRLWLELQALLEEIRLVQPKLIITTGKWALFFLTGCSTLVQNLGTYKDKKPFGGLSKFRSSVLYIHKCFNIDVKHILVPMYHTINALTMPDKAHIMDMDIQKICWMYSIIKEEGIEYFTKPLTDFIIGVDKDRIVSYLKAILDKLDQSPMLISVDIETKFGSTIDCIGISDELNKGVCVPFAGEKESSLWNIEDETELLSLIYLILTHEHCLMLCQNGSYEQQFFHKLWMIDVKLYKDSMIQAHVLRNYLQKDLAFLASLYCSHYSYWKGMQTHGKQL
jgi:hypothetical protein